MSHGVESCRVLSSMSVYEAVSVVILAKDEEQLIARAIASAWWADEVVVLDSGSSDRTCAIAAAMGTKVHHQAWLGWKKQHELAASLATHDWVFSMDADEIVTPELAEAIRATLGSKLDPRDGYVVQRREEFLGTLMPEMRRRANRRAFVRLYNRRCGQYDPELEIHEQIRCPGRLIALPGELLHWRNYDIGRQLETLNRNAGIEARMLTRPRRSFARLTLVCKPIARFVWLYVVCGNFRFGMKGYVWSVLHAGAEFVRHAKAWELENIQPTVNPPRHIWNPGIEFERKLAAAIAAESSQRLGGADHSHRRA